MIALDRRHFLGLATLGPVLMAAPRTAYVAFPRGHVAYVADMLWFDADGVAPASCLPLAPDRSMRFACDPLPWN